MTRQRILLLVLVLLGLGEGFWSVRRAIARWQGPPVAPATLRPERLPQEGASSPVSLDNGPVFSPAELYSFLSQAKKAEAISDPLQRCLAYPDPPGSHWSQATEQAYCHYKFQSVMPLSDIHALVETRHADELDHRLARSLHDQQTDPGARSILDVTYDVDFADTSNETRLMINEWKRQLPDSAFAYAASGLNYVALAAETRGEDSISATSKADISSMRRLFAQARGELDQAVQRNPHLIPAYIAMFRIATMEGDGNLANRAVREGTKADPSDYLLPFWRMWAATPNWGGSLAAMQQVAIDANTHVASNPLMGLLQVTPDAYATSLNYCNCQPASSAYRKVFDRLGSVDTLINAGGAANWSRHFEAAVVYQSEALRFAPDDVGMRIQRIYALGDIGENQWALDDAQRLVAKYPENANARLGLGNAYEAMKKYPEAEQSFKEAIALDKNNSWLVEALGNLYVRKTHEWDKGWQVADRLIQERPDSPAGWILRASIQKDQPRPGLVDTAHYFLEHFANDPMLATQRRELRATLPKGDPYLTPKAPVHQQPAR